MSDSLFIRFGRQLWQVTEKSPTARELTQFVRSLGETGGMTLEKATGKGLQKAGEAVKLDMVILSDAVKKMRKKGGGNSGAPAELWLPRIIEFPKWHPPTEVPLPKKPEVPTWRLPEFDPKSLPKEFPGQRIPPEFPPKKHFPGSDEDGGLGPVPVILPPKSPKRPPLKAAAVAHAN